MISQSKNASYWVTEQCVSVIPQLYNCTETTLYLVIPALEAFSLHWLLDSIG